MATLHLRRPELPVVVLENKHIPKYQDVLDIEGERWVVNNIVYNLPYPAVSIICTFLKKYDD